MFIPGSNSGEVANQARLQEAISQMPKPKEDYRDLKIDGHNLFSQDKAEAAKQGLKLMQSPNMQALLPNLVAVGDKIAQDGAAKQFGDIRDLTVGDQYAFSSDLDEATEEFSEFLSKPNVKEEMENSFRSGGDNQASDSSNARSGREGRGLLKDFAQGAADFANWGAQSLPTQMRDNIEQFGEQAVKGAEFAEEILESPLVKPFVPEYTAVNEGYEKIKETAFETAALVRPNDRFRRSPEEDGQPETAASRNQPQPNQPNTGIQGPEGEKKMNLEEFISNDPNLSKLKAQADQQNAERTQLEMATRAMAFEQEKRSTIQTAMRSIEKDKATQQQKDIQLNLDVLGGVSSNISG